MPEESISIPWSEKLAYLLLCTCSHKGKKGSIKSEPDSRTSTILKYNLTVVFLISSTAATGKLQRFQTPMEKRNWTAWGQDLVLFNHLSHTVPWLTFSREGTTLIMVELRKELMNGHMNPWMELLRAIEIVYYPGQMIVLCHLSTEPYKHTFMFVVHNVFMWFICYHKSS